MAYPNCVANDGPYGSFMADPQGAGIGIYIRCKFAEPGSYTRDKKPILQICGVAEREDVITMQPIAAGAVGTVKFANAGGEQFGQMAGACSCADALYTQADGKVGTATGSSAILTGKATIAGSDGGPVTYTKNTPIA
jgi:hypothetical protein